MTLNVGKLSLVLSLMLLIGLIYGPQPAYAQGGDSSSTIQNLIVNGGFEGGFQEGFGLGYGWGGFSNGNAVVGWHYDDWAAVVVAGNYAQRIEIRDTQDLDRYAGIYQTLAVIPGKQYKLTIKGMIRSEEGDIALSDYGYRVQYAIDSQGDVAWELVPESEWKELPWDEQPLFDPPDGTYRTDTFETTITAQSDKLTLYIRGWKKWLNNGSGVYNLDEVRFVGPAPAGFQAPVAQVVSTGSPDQPPAEVVQPATEEVVTTDVSAQVVKPDTDMSSVEAPSQPRVEPRAEVATEAQTPAQSSSPTQVELKTEASAPDEAAEQVQALAQVDTLAQAQNVTLPVAGQGDDDSIIYIILIGVILILILFIGAITATMQPRNLVE